MSTQEQNNTGSSSSTPDQSDSEGTAPLWKYVTKLDKQGLTGGTWKFECTFYKIIRQGSYSRVKGHLLAVPQSGVAACTKVTRPQRQAMKKLEEEFLKKKSESGAREVPLACETENSAKRRRSSFSPIVAAFGVEVREQLDQEIARMFYTGGLLFNLARNPYYHRSYQFAAAQRIDGYVPPGYNKLRTTLMDKEKAKVEKHLMVLKSTWKERGVSIVSDGWSDPTRKPLINFIATSANAPLFLKAVNCLGEVKDKFFIAERGH
ncbi:unnamed protein product [Microthlaspi erraticum]|uniref:DUF659 domain-containing protein n=1 Tax=Microthlaspi erraticum TaxID=1685480 RepID=A0A6D2JKU8_9BRAS|nr:unnamed protein product [Microthlaspi erraticum]